MWVLPTLLWENGDPYDGSLFTDAKLTDGTCLKKNAQRRILRMFCVCVFVRPPIAHRTAKTVTYSILLSVLKSVRHYTSLRYQHLPKAPTDRSTDWPAQGYLFRVKREKTQTHFKNANPLHRLLSTSAKNGKQCLVYLTRGEIWGRGYPRYSWAFALLQHASTAHTISSSSCCC